MTTRPENLRLHGAVDLSALRSPATGAAEGGTAAASGPNVIEVTERNFTEVVERSRRVPVVLDFWASWCAPCRQLSPVLEKLAAEGGGTWILGTVDVDANQRLAEAFRVSSIPAVHVVLDGQAVEGFVGVQPEAAIRQWIGQLLSVAPGGAPPEADAAGEAPADPAYAAARDAFARGDLPAARTAYEALAARNPADPEPARMLRLLALLERTNGLDAVAARRRADESPGDVAAQIAAADLDFLEDRIEDAIGRLVAIVRSAAGDDREAARQHVVELLDLLDPSDPRVVKGRQALASALY